MSEKVVLITGASGGIGMAAVRKFAAEGMKVAATDKKICDVPETKGVQWYEMDVTDHEQVRSVVGNIEEKHGEIEILVHTAGVFSSQRIHEYTGGEWDSILKTNTYGTYYVTETVTGYMKARRRGAVVVVSSNASKFPRIGMAAYAASKAAVSMYVKCLGLEMSEYNIRCNIVSPGSTDTDMQRQLWGESSVVPDEILRGNMEQYRLGIPLRKIATPAEIAEVLFFMTSDKSGHITMEEITVDGGATMGV